MINLPYLTNELRKDIIKMIYAAQSGHPGGSLSCIDILAMLFFGEYIKCNPRKPDWEGRDYYIQSKGHASPAIYSVLGELGYFPKEEYFRFRQVNSLLQGHPTSHIPGIEVATGSLGQGLSIAGGIALGLQTDKKKNRVFCLLGDGEIQEGQNWEAAMAASKYKLDNLVAILDNNGLQIDGKNNDIMPLGDLHAKFKAFGWKVIDLKDGHDFDLIKKALNSALKVKGKPCIIIAKTVKGKGVKYMENNFGWHGKAPDEEEYAIAMKELDRRGEKLKK